LFYDSHHYREKGILLDLRPVLPHRIILFLKVKSL